MNLLIKSQDTSRDIPEENDGSTPDCRTAAENGVRDGAKTVAEVVCAIEGCGQIPEAIKTGILAMIQAVCEQPSGKV